MEKALKFAAWLTAIAAFFILLAIVFMGFTVKEGEYFLLTVTTVRRKKVSPKDVIDIKKETGLLSNMSREGTGMVN